MAKVYAFLAEGLEEVECLAVVDVLRRSGVEVTLVSVGETKEIVGSHGIRLTADALFEETNPDQADILFLPGGMPGTLHLKDHEGLGELLKKAYADGKYIAAICAAPTVLEKYGLLEGKKATSYPAMEKELVSADYQTDKVVVDGNIITSRGMGTAIEFGAKMVEIMQGTKAKEELLESIVYGD